MVPNIVDSNDVRVVGESPHSSSFTGDTGPAPLIQLPRPYEREGHITVKERVMDEVDFLFAPFTKELLDLIAAIGKRGGLR
jgi:hypothetical protein